MSSDTRRIPGERLTARVLRRGTVRPSLGTPAAFYERFGLADPLAERGFIGADALDEDDGLYSFLSAAPYYAALRAQASWRSSRARRRLLGRIAAQSDSFSAGATRRRMAPEAAGARRFSLGSTLATDSMLTTLERPVSREELIEELEAEGWTPAGTRRREAPTRRLRRRSRRLAPAAQSLLDTIETAAPTARRAVQRIRQQIVDLDEGEQVIVVKELAKGVRGPLRRLAVVEADGANDSLDVRPVAVAAERGNAKATRRKGLRPVLHGSPTLKTLMFDDAVPDVVETQPRLRPVTAPRPTAARRRVAVSSASRDVQQQVAAGRAGPRTTSVSASSAEAPRVVRVQPMVRAARRSRAASIETTLPTARGTQVVEPLTVREQAAQTRVVRRAAVADINGPLTASPTAYVNDEAPRRRTVRTPTLAAPTTRLQANLFVPAAEASAPVARTPGVSRALQAQSEPSKPRRRMVQTATGFQFAQPAMADDSVFPDVPVRRRTVAAQRSTAAPKRQTVRTAAGTDSAAIDSAVPVAAESRAVTTAAGRQRVAGPRSRSFTPTEVVPRSERAVTRPTARAARRVLRVAQAPVAVGPVTGGPEAPVVRHVAAFQPTSRVASRATAADSPQRRRRVHLAPSPTEFVQLATPADTADDVVAPLARSSRPTTRAHERADSVARVDDRDVALSTASPARYVGQRTVASEQPLSKSPVRRIRTAAPDSVVLRPEETPVEPSPTARLTQRSRGATAQLAASDRLPAVPSKAQTATPRLRTIRSRAESPETVAVQRAQRPVSASVDTPARRMRIRAEDGTFLAPTDDAPQVTAGAAPRSAPASATPRRAAPVRVQGVEGRVVRKASVGTGSVVYAAARVEQALDSSDEVTSAPAARRAQTPLAARRRRSMRPVGYASASRDFSLLVPEVSTPVEPVERARARSSVPAASGTPSIRIEASGPLSRADLDSVLKQVSGVVRALERAERPSAATPVAHRVAQHQPEATDAFAPSMARSPVSRRVRMRTTTGQVASAARSLSTPIVAGASVRPGSTVASQTVRTAAGRSGVAAPGGAPQRDGQSVQVAGAPATRTSRAVVRADGVYAQSALVGNNDVVDEFTAVPAGTRHVSASPVAHAESRSTSTNTYGVAPSRLPAQRRVAAASATPTSARVGRSGGRVSTSAGRRPRLSQTLGRIARSTAPVGTLAAPGGSTPVQDDGRAWSHRAETGSGVVRGPVAQAESTPRAADGTPLARPAAGTVLHALARATSAEDVVRVIMERADGLRGISKELPAPAVELVQRIVRATDEAQVLSANVMPVDELAPLSVHNRAPSSDSEESVMNQHSWNGQRSRPARRSQAGAGQSMRLANKLMQLVHLAENERRLADAQRHVRMAQEGENASGGGGEAASEEAGEAPNMKALQRAVYEAVLREIELSKQRGQGSSNGW